LLIWARECGPAPDPNKLISLSNPQTEKAFRSNANTKLITVVNHHFDSLRVSIDHCDTITITLSTPTHLARRINELCDPHFWSAADLPSTNALGIVNWYFYQVG
jgi:hypothetical protein